MLHTGMDGADAVGSFNTQIKTDRSGKAYVNAYATSGGVIDTPYVLLWHGSGYAATALGTGIRGKIGIPGETVGSGSLAWYQVRGFASDVQGAATSFTAGSFGHAIYWGGATGLGCSASAYVGVASQVGILMEDLGAGANSTTANIWLTGAECTSI